MLPPPSVKQRLFRIAKKRHRNEGTPQVPDSFLQPHFSPFLLRFLKPLVRQPHSYVTAHPYDVLDGSIRKIAPLSYQNHSYSFTCHECPPRSFFPTTADLTRTGIFVSSLWENVISGQLNWPFWQENVPSLSAYGLTPEGAKVINSGPVLKGFEPWVLAGHGVPACDALSIYGTDLGFSATVEGITYFLFGDTWYKQGNGTVVSSLGPNRWNDTLATIPVSKRPKPGKEHPSLEFFQSEIRVVQNIEAQPSVELPLGDALTPMGAFGTAQNLFAAFGVTGEDKNIHLQLARYTGKGTIFETIGKQLDLGHPEQLLERKDLIFRDRFVNVAFATAPAQNWWVKILSQNLSHPLAKIITNPIYVWGRSSFTKILNQSETTNLYLMVLDGDELDQWEAGEDKEITRYYFTGTEEAPKWEVGENTQPTALLKGAEDIPFPNQMSVAYNPHLGLWVMVYGGSFDRSLKTSPQLSALLDDNKEENRVYVRLARNPWGPWSEKLVIYSTEMEGNCKILHDPNAVKEINCTPEQSTLGSFSVKFPAVCFSTCVNSDDMTPALPLYDYYGVPGVISEGTHGFEYGVSLWSEAHFKYEKDGWIGSTFYFVMSTYNPYRVILMKVTLGWPK